MAKPLTEKSINHSTRDRFCFSFFCDRCGWEWTSEVFPFDNQGFTSVDDSEVEERLWAEEHRQAFERANLEAVFHFNYCEECGRWVCDSCFALDSGTIKDTCLDCRIEGATGSKRLAGEQLIDASQGRE